MIALFPVLPAESYQWPDDLRAAVAAYPRLQTAPGFTANFERRLQARRAYSQTWRGRIENFACAQIGGLCVWRLLGSTLAGAAPPALGLALMLMTTGAATSKFVPIKAPPFSALAWRELERQWNWKTPLRAQNQLVALWLDGATSLNGATALAGGGSCPNVV